MSIVGGIAYILGAAVAFGLVAIVLGAIARMSLWAWRRYHASSDWFAKLFFGVVGLFGFGFLAMLALAILEGIIFGG